jgi:filamentous hemagglutinin
MQGEWGEQAFGGNLNQFSKNFKTFDNFNFETGVATSAKTLDLEASSYLKTPASITSTLNGYVDKAAGFTQARGGGFFLDASDITKREVGVLAIGSPNTAQFSALQASQQYAAGQGVQFTLKSTPLIDPLIKGLLASPRPTNTQSQSK